MKAGLAFVLHWLNTGLYTHNGPWLFWSARRRKVVRQDLPSTLLAAAWLQFAEAVMGRRKSRQGAKCGRRFETPLGENPADRTYCAVSCRVSAYRERQTRARQLRAAGRPLKEIAAELGSDVRTVKGWITGKKEK